MKPNTHYIRNKFFCKWAKLLITTLWHISKICAFLKWYLKFKLTVTSFLATGAGKFAKCSIKHCTHYNYNHFSSAVNWNSAHSCFIKHHFIKKMSCVQVSWFYITFSSVSFLKTTYYFILLPFSRIQIYCWGKNDIL